MKLNNISWILSMNRRNMVCFRILTRFWSIDYVFFICLSRQRTLSSFFKIIIENTIGRKGALLSLAQIGEHEVKAWEDEI